jgi:hypothetical protein
MSTPRAYVWTVNALGSLCIALALVSMLRFPISPAWLIPAGLAIVSGATVMRMKSVPASFSIGDTFSFAALFVYGPEAATLTVALDTLAISLRLKGPVERIVFNSAAPSLAMWCAGTFVFRVLDLPLPVHPSSLSLVLIATCLSVAISFLLGSWFVATAVALHQGASVPQVWRQHFARLWTGPAAGAYVGALVALYTDRLGRPYRAAMSTDAAFAILRERRGTMYDERVVDKLIVLQPKLAATSPGTFDGRDSSVVTRTLSAQP